jgi:DNA repair protein RAD50
VHSKCAEIDKLIPEFMGVSQAVLQNVIFCHQEESNWILGEPKVLKDKFDAIFASTRYSKALEQVKKTQAELKITLKDFEKDEAQQKEIKRHAYEFKQNLRKRQAESEDTKKKKLELQADIKKEQEQLDRCHQGLRRYTEYDEFRKESKQKIETWKQEEGKLSSRIGSNALAESDDELRKAKRDLEKQIQDNESAKRRHRDEV